MRIKRRGFIVILVAAGAVVWAGVAMASASSTASLSFAPSTGLDGNPPSPGVLSFHTQTAYTNPGNDRPGGATKRIRLFFDDDFSFHPKAFPQCRPAQIQGQIDMAEAISSCGRAKLGAGTVQAIAANGLTINACVLLFNGRADSSTFEQTILLFVRGQISNPSSINCTRPATNHEGNASILLKGILRTVATPSFGRMLDVKRIDSASVFPLTDLNLKITRPHYVEANCPDPPWRMRALFKYNDDTTQTVDSTQPCT